MGGAYSTPRIASAAFGGCGLGVKNGLEPESLLAAFSNNPFIRKIVSNSNRDDPPVRISFGTLLYAESLRSLL